MSVDETSDETIVNALQTETMATQADSEDLVFAWMSFKRGLYSIHTLLVWLLKSIAYRIGFWLGAGALAVVFLIPFLFLEPQPIAVKTVVAILFTSLVLTLYGAMRLKYDDSQRKEDQSKSVE